MSLVQIGETMWNSESGKENHQKSQSKIDITEVFKTQQVFGKDDIVLQTDLTFCRELSEYYDAKIYFKREDQQKGKTYKIRGAYYYYLNNINCPNFKDQGFVAVSDGNFATSVAIISGIFSIKTIVFVPHSCFPHKIDLIKKQSNGFTEIIQAGADFEECEILAKSYCEEHKIPLVQPHESSCLMAGYATLAKQILDSKVLSKIDYIFVPSGGGALVSSIGSFFKQISPDIKVIAVQPDICTPFSSSILHGKIQTSEKVSKFCNGSSVKKISEACYEIGKTCVDGFVAVTQNKLAEKIIKLYSMGYICEPSGALGVAGLDKMKSEIKGKSVVCVLTGSNMDLTKLEEAREMNVISKGYKNYYIIEVPNKKNGIYELITGCFKVNDVITIQYNRKVNKQTSQALLAVESPTQQNVQQSQVLLNNLKYKYENINDRSELLDLFF